MKAEVRIGNGSFVPGVWMNAHDALCVINRFPDDSFLRSELIEKLQEAKQTAECQQKAYDVEAGK